MYLLEIKYYLKSFEIILELKSTLFQPNQSLNKVFNIQEAQL